VDVYLQEIIEEGVQLAAEEEAVRRAQTEADRMDLAVKEHGSMWVDRQDFLLVGSVSLVVVGQVLWGHNAKSTKMRLT
jgi:hypothetical protein